jgi:DNA-directed RNA polymerase subunit M/transcription elongation factor TFIIS
MKHKRIKLVCDKCGTILRWKEDKYIPFMLIVEVCPECLQQMTKEQRLMYERGKEAVLENKDKLEVFVLLDNLSDDLGITHENAEGEVVDITKSDINYSC